MSDKAENIFLRQSNAESISLLKDCISGKNTPFWDIIVITTATYRQEKCYVNLIAEREKQNLLPKNTNFIVITDKNEERIGSGGSTLCVFAKLLELCGNDVKKLLSKKILILHSGGDAKRLPHSAPLGKLFAHAGGNIYGDLKNPSTTVFDDLMVSFAGLPSRMSGGILVVSADAFFRFNHTQLDLDTDYAVAFAMRAPVEEGTTHGVFTEKDNDGYASDFLHKLSEDELQKHGAVSQNNTVDLDIGVTYFGKVAVEAIINLISTNGQIDEQKLAAFANKNVKLSLYGDIIYPMAKNSTLEDFMQQSGDGFLSDDLKKLRPILFETLHNVPLRLGRSFPALIRNMGTTHETFQTLNFFKYENEDLTDKEYNINIALIAKISSKAKIGENCFIENSVINDNVVIGSNCLVSGCNLSKGFILPDNTAMHCVRLKDRRWVCRVWSINDDIKSADKWLDRPIDKKLLAGNVSELWRLKLFPVCDTQEESLSWVQRFIFGLNENELTKLDSCEKLSLSDTADFDIDYLLKARNELNDEVRTELFLDKLLNGNEPKDYISYLGIGENAERRITLALTNINNGKYSKWQDKMRLYICLAESAELLGIKSIGGDKLREKGYAELREATALHTPQLQRNNIKWVTGTAEVSLPVRVNFGGTWSDAPPYCFEHGGTMLNAAVKLDGTLPIYAKAKVISEPVIKFTSEDLNCVYTFKDLAPLLDCQNPADPYILFKAALSVTGILKAGGGTLEEQLKKSGGGVHITTHVNVPKGSGLGTSSIITGAIISALNKLNGQELHKARLSDDVLLAEQLMTTGGGWQDAIGGIYPGIKLTNTEPGIPQKYDVEPVKLNDKTKVELDNRGFLVYTGQRRLARSVLRRVLSNYVCNHTDSLYALEETQKLAVVMAYELKRGNISNFGQLLSEHMRLLRLLDTSSSNTALDYIMNSLLNVTDGVTLCGAAGGGFMYGIMKDNVSFADIQSILNCKLNTSYVKLFKAGVIYD